MSAMDWMMLLVVGGGGELARRDAGASRDLAPGAELAGWYHEDAPAARRVAALRAHAETFPEGTLLRVDVSAVGPRVDTLPDWRGIAGHNPITARELERLVRRDGIRVVSTRAEDGARRPGRIVTLPPERLRVRQQRRDGSLDLGARDPGPRSGLRIEAPLGGSGCWRTVVEVDENARLAVVTRVSLAGATIEGFESLPAVAFRMPAGAGQDAVRTAVVPDMAWIDLERWRALDLEGRWYEYVSCVSPDSPAPETEKARWLAFLGGQGDGELLEGIAVYHADVGAVRRLQEISDPRWFRCALWLADSPDSHTAEAMAKLLENAVPVAPLRPWTADAVFAALLEVRGVRAWGDEASALPGVLYEHQVLRALGGLRHARLPSAPWADRVLAWIDHPEVRIRRSARLALGEFATAERVRSALLRRAREGQQPSDQEVALLAFSYAAHPEVDIVLHEIAADPSHGAWRAAVSRLGERGDAFTLQYFGSRPPASLDAEQRAFWGEHWQAIVQRCAPPQEPADLIARLQPCLERAAFADIHCHPLESALVPWTRQTLALWCLEPEVAAAMRRLAERYVPAPGIQDETRWSSLQDRVRKYAAEIVP